VEEEAENDFDGDEDMQETNLEEVVPVSVTMLVKSGS
jgi:hypothetical protein